MHSLMRVRVLGDACGNRSNELGQGTPIPRAGPLCATFQPHITAKQFAAYGAFAFMLRN